MPQSDGARPHGDTTPLFLWIAVEVTQRTRQSLAYYAVRFDQIVGERRLAVIDVSDDRYEAGGIGWGQHLEHSIFQKLI